MQRPFIQSSCLFTNTDTPRPFSKLHIDSFEFLDSIEERSLCPKCCKSRKYFCYTCYVLLDDIKQKVPFLKLPIKIDIIKHPSEVDGKCTSTHAALLAPDDVKVYTFPDIPDYTNENVILVFPSKNAVPMLECWKTFCKKQECASQLKEDTNLTEICKQFSACVFSADLTTNLNTDFSGKMLDENINRSSCPFDKVVFIDSTWRQAKRIYEDKRLKSLPCVVLNSHKSLFWRHQRDKPLSYLATIEAVYYFLVELDQLLHPDRPYHGQYDNMLFFFKYMYQKIRKVYDPRVVAEIRGETM